RGRDRLARIWADHGYQGDWTGWARYHHGITIQIVERPEGMRGFQVLPRRWVVERTLAWITPRPRCPRDYEPPPSPHAPLVCWPAILQMPSNLARLPQPAATLQKQPL